MIDIIKATPRPGTVIIGDSNAFLGGEWPALAGPILNLGVSGTGAYYWLERVEAGALPLAENYIVMVGTNDYAINLELWDWTISRLVYSIPATSKVVVLGIPPNDYTYPWGTVPPYRIVAQNVILAQLMRSIYVPSPFNLDNWSDNTDDGIHYNDKGRALVAAALNRHLVPTASN